MKFLIRLLIRGYQNYISPVLHKLAGPNAGCRFEPTCSHYFLQAVEKHGVFRGCWLGVRRILRCNPWGPFGPDPVPERRSRDCRCGGKAIENGEVENRKMVEKDSA